MPRLSSNLLRWIKIFLALALMVCLMGMGEAEAKKKKKRALPPPPADLPGHVNYLARQLTYLPLDESEPITSQIQKLVVDHLTVWLGSQNASAVEVRRELDYAFAQLRYPLFAQTATFAEPWSGGLLIGAGYSLGWSEYNRVNVVALFEVREGKTLLAGLTHFVPFTDLNYEFLSGPGSKDFRFFIYGLRPGKSQLRLTAMLYSFDGQSLKSLWETHDVYDGKLDVGHDKVVIRYLREDDYVRETERGRKPMRHEAVYKLVPQGLELESDHEIPF